MDHCTDVAGRVSELERQMILVEHQVGRFERNHDDLPMRVGRLEMIAQSQSELLKDLASTVRTLGQKVMYGLGVAGAIMGLVNLIGPHILRVLTQ